MRFLVVLALCAVAVATKRTYYGHQILSVKPKTDFDISMIKITAEDRENVELIKPTSTDGLKIGSEVYMRVSPKVSKMTKVSLSAKNIEYTVAVEDLQAVFDKEAMEIEEARMSGKAMDDYYNHYHTWQEIEQWTADIAASSNLVTREVIGQSYHGRNLYMLTVTADTSSNDWFVMDCGFHAREWISPAFCQRFVYDLITYYGNGDAEIQNLMNRMQFKILTVFNPDGYDYSWTNDRMWRKTRNNNAGSPCVGTDPNRNFNAGWGGGGASSNPCDETYMGPVVESAPETKAYSNFLRANKQKIKGYMTVHSYGQFIIVPYSYTSVNSLQYPANFNELVSLAGDMATKIQSVYGTVYDYGNGADEFYVASGGSDDMAILDAGIPISYTIELRPCGTVRCAATGFDLPESEIKATCDETFEGIVVMANYALNNYGN